MRKILFVLLLLPSAVFAQTDTVIVQFALDTFRIDSIFLRQTDSVFSASERRPIVTVRNLFFNDTSELTNHIAQINAEYGAIAALALSVDRQKAEWQYRYERLVCLRDSVFYGASCTGIGARMVTMPPPEEPDDDGFWVVYPQVRAAWVGKLEDIESDAVILHPNGVQSSFKKPKPKKRKK